MQSSKLDSTEGHRRQSAPFQPWPLSGPACVLTFNLPVITWQSLVARVGFAEAPAGSPGVNDDQAIRTANAI